MRLLSDHCVLPRNVITPRASSPFASFSSVSHPYRCSSLTIGATSIVHSSIAALVALPPAIAPFSGAGEPSFSPLAFFAPKAALVLSLMSSPSYSAMFAMSWRTNLVAAGECICGMSQAITGTPCSKSVVRKLRLRVSRSILAMMSVAFSRLQCSRAFLSSFRCRSERLPLSISVYSAMTSQSPPFRWLLMMSLCASSPRPLWPWRCVEERR